MNQKNVIPAKIRKAMDMGTDYKTCALYGQHGHECGGRITREHAIIVKGSKVQLQWAIIPVCAKGHAVDQYQDAGTMRKDLNEWVALNRATDAQILDLFNEKQETLLCKAHTLLQRKRYLNVNYGPYVRKYPAKTEIVPEDLPVDKFWYLVPDEEKLIIRKCCEFFEDSEGRYYEPRQMISKMIREFGAHIDELIKATS